MDIYRKTRCKSLEWIIVAERRHSLKVEEINKDKIFETDRNKREEDVNILCENKADHPKIIVNHSVEQRCGKVHKTEKVRYIAVVHLSEAKEEVVEVCTSLR